MIDFLMSNPLLIVVVVLLAMLLFVMLFLRVKSKDSKKAKENEDSKVEQEAKIEQSEEQKKEQGEEKTDESQVLTLKRKKDKTKRLKKTKEKPSIERIFAKKKDESTASQSSGDDDSKYSEEEFLKDRQFVKTSKTVSKLAKMEQQLEPDSQEEVANEDKPIIQYTESVSRGTRKILTRQKHGHFDRSRRLKRCVDTNDFNDMFCSHISEDYLNFDIDSHLRKTEIITDSLYKRASQTIANSAVKILGDEEDEHEYSAEIRSNKESMKIWLEQKRREELSRIMSGDSGLEDDEEVVRDEFEDINLDAKNLLVVDSIMKRKTLRKK